MTSRPPQPSPSAAFQQAYAHWKPLHASPQLLLSWALNRHPFRAADAQAALAAGASVHRSSTAQGDWLLEAVAERRVEAVGWLVDQGVSPMVPCNHMRPGRAKMQGITAWALALGMDEARLVQHLSRSPYVPHGIDLWEWLSDPLEEWRVQAFPQSRECLPDAPWAYEALLETLHQAGRLHLPAPQSPEGHGTLIEVCRRGLPGMIRWLCQHGFDLNAVPSPTHQPAWFHALPYASESTIAWLLDQGANPKAIKGPNQEPDGLALWAHSDVNRPLKARLPWVLACTEAHALRAQLPSSPPGPRVRL